MTEKTPPLPTLPMHLMLTLGCWLSSPFALRHASAALPPSNPALQQALAKEAKSRASSLLTGLLRYVESPYKRTVAEPPCIWEKGNARLLDYGLKSAAVTGGDRPVVLFVPSLINRYYVLDLEEDRSFLRFCAANGLYPLVLDWGAPGGYEEQFGVDDYITDILIPAIDYIARISAQKVTLVGYCMGGVLALAAAKLNRPKIAGLALLATPWDFHCKEFLSFVVEKPWKKSLEDTIAGQKQLPANVIQSLFYLTDPWVFEQKFRRFAEVQPDSRAARDFIALEHWVNDGVPMTTQVAKDCLIGWAQENALAKGDWEIAGKSITPAGIKLPAFIAIPKNDHVVPYDCALPLAAALPHAKTLNPGAGHVGMIVGSHAKRELWQPFVEWVKTIY